MASLYFSGSNPTVKLEFKDKSKNRQLDLNSSSDKKESNFNVDEIDEANYLSVKCSSARICPPNLACYIAKPYNDYPTFSFNKYKELFKNPDNTITFSCVNVPIDGTNQKVVRPKIEIKDNQGNVLISNQLINL